MAKGREGGGGTVPPGDKITNISIRAVYGRVGRGELAVCSTMVIEPKVMPETGTYVVWMP